MITDRRQKNREIARIPEFLSAAARIRSEVDELCETSGNTPPSDLLGTWQFKRINNIFYDEINKISFLRHLVAAEEGLDLHLYLYSDSYIKAQTVPQKTLATLREFCSWLYTQYSAEARRYSGMSRSIDMILTERRARSASSLTP